MALAMILVAGVMYVRNGKCRLLKKMMDTMGRGRREKEHKKGDDPQGADGAEIRKCCSRCLDNYPYQVLFTHSILIKKTCSAQAQSGKLKLIIG
jgi:hypothetical protein